VNKRFSGPPVGIACCAAIFWPGSLIFGFPGVMGRHWQTVFQVSRVETGRILFFVLAAVGIFMFIIGRLQERYGPARLFTAGAVLCAAGTVWMPRANSITGIYLWAFLMGASSAFIYLPGLTVVQRWYPERRGLVSGLFNLSFAGSAALMSPVYNQMLVNYGPQTVARMASVMALVFGLAAACVIRFPDVMQTPSSTGRADIPQVPTSLTVIQSLKTQSFWLLWSTWALAGAAGISMVMLSVSFGTARGLSTDHAVLLLTAFNLTNGLSRLISGFISDYLGRKQTLALTFLFGAVAYIMLERVNGLAVWMVLTALIGYGFGTLFAVSAPLASDCFGMDHFGAIFGLVFTAYGFVAGVLGPWVSGWLLDVLDGNFNGVFLYLGALYLAAALLIMKTTPRTECAYPGG